ncbi:alpha-xylosidase [Egicoccus halophilus]|uniref:alpha-D-xyloside xylohydrolase n=1 Tax=Egicoccus halophilus TaxID=1670830 RepID=A0A8J3A5Q2_9ACTN|nr:alpha-xylosidase [Egicoccus halophilus]GGI03731.1 alpha-xylosidase [Egicoccus halophilus]
MKFSDGYWLMRDGVRAHVPAEAYDVRPGPGCFSVDAPTHPIRHRGDTLKGPVLTVRCSSPMDEVIRVSVTHHAGGTDPGPHFAVLPDRPDAEVHVDDTEAVLQAGRLAVRVRRGAPFGLSFEADGRVLTASGTKAMAKLELDGRSYVREQLELGLDQHVYGLGERFGPFVKNGQVVDIWNADGGTSSEQAYKNVPFYLTDGGYGVFVDTPAHVSFEVASEVNSRVSFSVEGQTLSYLVIHGPSPKAILERYTALTGRPALPPAWSFGLWLSTSFTTDYDEATVTSFIEGMEQRELPLSVFHFDCFWMREFHWCDFEWDPRTFPDPKGMLQRLKDRGLKVCVWINPYIAQRSPLFEEGREAGYLLRRPDGSVWQWDLWQPGMALVDFTNPAARAWYVGKLEALLDMGVDSFKTDFGERVPTDVVWHDGSDPALMHNYYAHLYNASVFELLERRRGRGDAVVFARSATAGGQQFPVHWGGDCESTFVSMAESLRGGLSLGLSGFGFWSHDIGGFEGTPDPAVFKRWIAFGLLSSHSRLHGSGSYRVPWLVDEESVDVLRSFTHLKLRLMPYLWGAAHEATQQGVPVMRAMPLEFPDDPACTHLDRQYLLGGDLLVAPVFSASGDVSYYVPEGAWTSLLTGEVVQGPGWRTERHGFDSLPLLVRPGAVLATTERVERPDHDLRDGVVLRVHGLADGTERTVVVPAVDDQAPARFTLRRAGGRVTATAEGAPGPWSLVLVGVDGEVVDGDRAEDAELQVTAATGVGALVVDLADGDDPRW